MTQLGEQYKLQHIRLIWGLLLGIGFPAAILYPFADTYIFKHLAAGLEVPFDFSNGLLFIASILFGFASLMVISKEWVDRRVWTVLIPPLVLIMLAGISIGNLALGTGDSIQLLAFSSAAFNANVVSTAFILGYITQKLPKRHSNKEA